VCEPGIVVVGTPGAVVVVVASGVVVVTDPVAVVVVTDPATVVVVDACATVVVVVRTAVVVVVDGPEVVVVAASRLGAVVVVVERRADVVVVVDPRGLVVVVVERASVVVVGFSVVVVVGFSVVVVAAVAHVGLVMVLSSRVTAPFRASTRPSTTAPVSSVAEVRASTLPTKVVVVPRVAELPTCQNTLQAWAPLISLTVLLVAVMRVDPASKTKTEPRLFCPSRVTVPVRPNEEDALYTPGASVWPPRSAVTTVAGVRPAASLYAVLRSAWACLAAPLGAT
jgi:hypothetical protein